MDHYGKLISDDDVDAMFAAVDTDNNGFIEYTEFVIASINQKKLLSVDKLKATFKMFDKDGNGSITPSEIKTVLQTDSSIPNEVIQQIMSQVDENGDGEISLDEFIHLMTEAAEKH